MTIEEHSLPKQMARIPVIKTMLMQGKTIQQIADTCGVHSDRIDADLRWMRETGEMEQWLEQEFLRLHKIVVNNNPELAYKVVGNLLAKTLVQKVEAKEEITNITLEWKRLDLNTDNTLPATQGTTRVPREQGTIQNP